MMLVKMPHKRFPWLWSIDSILNSNDLALVMDADLLKVEGILEQICPLQLHAAVHVFHQGPNGSQEAVHQLPRIQDRYRLAEAVALEAIRVTTLQHIVLYGDSLSGFHVSNFYPAYSIVIIGNGVRRSLADLIRKSVRKKVLARHPRGTVLRASLERDHP